MNKNQQKNRMGAVIILLAAACLNGYAQQDSTKVSSDSKEEGNRNVMLNAASANGPREISIGCLLYTSRHSLLEGVNFTLSDGYKGITFWETFCLKNK